MSREIILSFLTWAWLEKDYELAKDKEGMTIREERNLVDEYVKESKKNGN